MHLENQALFADAQDDLGLRALTQNLSAETRFGSSQYFHTTIAVQLRAMRMIMGENWAPDHICFDHPEPADTRVHRLFFKCPLRFDAGSNAIVVARKDFATVSPNGNRAMLAYLERQLSEHYFDLHVDFVARVRQHVISLLGDGDAHLSKVAQIMATSERTLQRKLQEHGSSFREIVSECRKKVATEYFKSSPKPNLSELAGRLGFSEASAVSRFLSKSSFDCTS